MEYKTPAHQRISHVLKRKENNAPPGAKLNKPDSEKVSLVIRLIHRIGSPRPCTPGSPLFSVDRVGQTAGFLHSLRSHPAHCASGPYFSGRVVSFGRGLGRKPSVPADLCTLSLSLTPGPKPAQPGDKL